MSSRLGWMMVLMAGIGTVCIGCQQPPSPGLKERQDLRDAWARGEVSEESVVQHPEAVTVAMGPSPLIYEARQSGVAHLRDATTGAELASAPVTRGTILRIDESTGVFVNAQRVRPGPMPAGHGYTISMDLEHSEGWHTSVMDAPSPAVSGKQPAKSPAQQ
ncbi:MAG TPA: hypothetical protein VN541_23610 [Tepidisphaeraceae bacterium]|nr:hypothetical protein [Tepidisphaeraceae bacterium]